jgi:hypothetical protein
MSGQPVSDTTQRHIDRILAFTGKDFELMYREPGGEIPHPFLTPGSGRNKHE